MQCGLDFSFNGHYQTEFFLKEKKSHNFGYQDKNSPSAYTKGHHCINAGYSG
jgi:hypothetical protein